MEIWNIINAIASLAGTITAIVALIVALYKVGNRKHPKLIITYDITQQNVSLKGLPKKVPVLTITVANCGISPVFIQECGVDFCNTNSKPKQKEKYTHWSLEGQACLKPGEMNKWRWGMISDNSDYKLKNKNAEYISNAKAFIYIKLSMGNKIWLKTNHNYASIVRELNILLDEQNSNKEN